MNVGDKIMCEGEITAVGEGFYRVRFPRLGAQAVTHVRIAAESCRAKPVRKPALD